MVGVVPVLVFLEEAEDLGLPALVPFGDALDAGGAVEVSEGRGEGFEGGEEGGGGEWGGGRWANYVCLTGVDFEQGVSGDGGGESEGGEDVDEHGVWLGRGG
jgi:hypothetical protein